MVSRQQIEEANYKQYGNAIEGIGQCCFEPCDHQEKTSNNGEEKYYCRKLEIFVHPYDSCKYHSTLVQQYAKILIQEEKEKKEKRKKRLSALIIVGVYLFIVFICNLIYG